jgi:hypothetical protein
VDPDPDPRIHASDLSIRIQIRIRILDPDPGIFVIDLQDANKKLISLNKIFCLLLFECTFTSFFKEKIQKESQNSRNQGFSYYFCMIIEGSESGSGSIPLTNGSGSGSRRPKNMWIRWIRIRNTVIICLGSSLKGQLCEAVKEKEKTCHATVLLMYLCNVYIAPTMQIYIYRRENRPELYEYALQNTLFVHTIFICTPNS